MDNESKIYTEENEIKDRVYNDYRQYDTELNSLFFDFQVKAPKKVLLQAYAEIQDTINGDYVGRLVNPQIKQIEDPNHPDQPDIVIHGKEADLIPEGEYEDVYSGNYKDFLESFNDRELETGLCRIMEVEEEEDLIGGIKLDFVF